MYILKFRQQCAFLTSLLLQIPEVYVKKKSFTLYALPIRYTLQAAIFLITN